MTYLTFMAGVIVGSIGILAIQAVFATGQQGDEE